MKYTAIEIDKFAVKVSDDNHEGIVRYYDVREVKGEMLGKVDFFCGGFAMPRLFVFGQAVSL